jgi:hypothetical protein
MMQQAATTSQAADIAVQQCMFHGVVDMHAHGLQKLGHGRLPPAI